MKIITLVLSTLLILAPKPVLAAAHWETTLNEPSCLHPDFLKAHQDSCSVEGIGKELTLNGVYKDPEGGFDMSVNFWVPLSKHGAVTAIPDSSEFQIFTKIIRLAYHSPYCEGAAEGLKHVAIMLENFPVAAKKECDLKTGLTLLTVTDSEVIEKVIEEMRTSTPEHHILWKDDIGFKFYIPTEGFSEVYMKESDMEASFQHAAMVIKSLH